MLSRLSFHYIRLEFSDQLHFRFLRLACTSEFLARSIMALSASRFAWMTKSIEADTMATAYKRQATHGIRQALCSFSHKNADEILAASIVLSIQVYEW